MHAEIATTREFHRDIVFAIDLDYNHYWLGVMKMYLKDMG
jgi:hypothetical protein